MVSACQGSPESDALLPIVVFDEERGDIMLTIIDILACLPAWGAMQVENTIDMILLTPQEQLINLPDHPLAEDWIICFIKRTEGPAIERKPYGVETHTSDIGNIIFGNIALEIAFPKTSGIGGPTYCLNKLFDAPWPVVGFLQLPHVSFGKHPTPKTDPLQEDSVSSIGNNSFSIGFEPR
jgi:hypothetical protein